MRHRTLTLLATPAVLGAMTVAVPALAGVDNGPAAHSSSSKCFVARIAKHSVRECLVQGPRAAWTARSGRAARIYTGKHRENRSHRENRGHGQTGATGTCVTGPTGPTGATGPARTRRHGARVRGGQPRRSRIDRVEQRTRSSLKPRTSPRSSESRRASTAWHRVASDQPGGRAGDRDRRVELQHGRQRARSR